MLSSNVKYLFSEKYLEEQKQKHSLNDYTILGVLGASTYVVVFHVVHKLSGNEYVLKVIEYSEESTGEKYKHLAKTTLAKTDLAKKFKGSKYICPVHQSWICESEAKSYVYVLMNFYPQGNLGNTLKSLSKPLDEKRILKWVLQISCGLEELHQEELIHRNLKPSNLLLQGGNLRIADFGIGTRQIDQAPTTGAELIYIAPEEENPSMPLTGAVDIWGLGAILYKLLTLAPIYSVAPDIEELVRNVPNRYSQKSILLLRKLLEFDPLKRPTATEVKTAVMASLLETRISALGALVGDKHPFSVHVPEKKPLYRRRSLDDTKTSQAAALEKDKVEKKKLPHRHSSDDIKPFQDQPFSYTKSSRAQSVEAEKQVPYPSIEKPVHYPSIEKTESQSIKKPVKNRRGSNASLWQTSLNSEICKLFDNTPWYIACKDNTMVVTENFRVHLLTNNKPVMVIGSNAGSSIKGEFNIALGVAIKDETFFVADYLNHRIQCFNLATGKFLYDFKVEGKPGGITLTHDQLCVTSWSPNQIGLYSLQGKLLRKSKCKSSPFGLTSWNEKIYVCEGSHKKKEAHQIEIFSSDNLYSMSSFGSRGNGPKQFDSPYDIVLRENRFFYISDNWNNRIQIWNTDGEFVTTWCKRGGAIGEVYSPIGLSTRDQNEDYNLYVVDGGNKRIQVFK